METLGERLAPLVRTQGPLCIRCLAELVDEQHGWVRQAVMGLARSPEFSYKVACARCGTQDPIELPVGPH